MAEHERELSDEEFEMLKEALKDFKIDFIDLLILSVCFDKKYSVGELQRKMNIAYKNLLPHIKRLEKYDFIIVEDKGLGKRKEISTNKGQTDVIAFLNIAGIPQLLKRVRSNQNNNKNLNNAQG